MIVAIVICLLALGVVGIVLNEEYRAEGKNDERMDGD